MTGHERLLRAAWELGDDEHAIVGSMAASDRWLVLTTSRLVWRKGHKVTAVSTDDIVDAVADLQALQESERTKLEMNELELRTKAGVYTIEVEPGEPLSGVWHVLKNIGARNRRA